jgi:hypothetical protein
LFATLAGAFIRSPLFGLFRFALALHLLGFGAAPLLLDP